MVGPGELLLILGVIVIILLLVRGPKVLPQFGEAIGKTVKGFRDNITDDSDKSDEAALDDTAKADQATTDADKDDAGTNPSA